ncbi:MAG: holo-ACP synthase, partial [Dehalococcoidia bacterium]
FAAKEAVIKTLGRGGSGLSWLEIEILPGPNDAPYVKLSGRARSKAEELGLKELSVSLSHCQEYAVAFSVGHAA